MKSKFLVFLMTLVCALCMAGLSACGGNGGNASSSAAPAESSSATESSASATESSAESAAASSESDEDLIKQDAQKIISSIFSKESIEAILEANESLASMKELGFDVPKFAELINGLMSYEVTNVKIDGNTAVATMKISYPEWNEEVTAELEKKATAALEGIDPQSMSQEEAMAAYMDAYFGAIKSTEFPTTAQEFTMDYIKDGDTWKMKDGDSFQDEIASLSSSLGATAPAEQ